MVPPRFLSFVLILLLCAGGSIGFAAAPTAPPNVVLILTDDLGYNDLSCYRKAHPETAQDAANALTPNLDSLAADGMRFTDFYAGAAVCSPSRGALLTGRNSTRLGIYNWIPPRQPMHLREQEVTVAELLKTQGYHTGHFGKWHLTAEGMGQPLPMDQGFDDAFYTYNNAEPSHENPVNFHRNGVPVGPLQGYAADLVANEAIRWLESLAGSSRPFYLNLWFNEPHERVAAPAQLTARHDRHAAYYGCIENMDLAVGRVLDFLENRGLAENTIVMFTSDNGSQVRGSNLPLRGAKAFNFEGGIRVPFLARWPGRIPTGAVAEAPCSFTDVLPTIAAFAGAELPEERFLDGESRAEVFLGNAPDAPREKPIFFFRYFHEPVCMLRDGDWILLGYHDEPLPWSETYATRELAKLKPKPDEPQWAMWGFQPAHMEFLVEAVPRHFELYRIDRDIAQKADVAGEHPAVTERMKRAMLRLREEMIRDGGDWYAGAESE